MTAPPPMPNSPARSPVTTPPMTIASASHRISSRPTPSSNILVLAFLYDALRRDVRQFAIPVQDAVRDERQRRDEIRAPRLRARCGVGEMPAEGARPRHRAEQAVQMARDRVQ